MIFVAAISVLFPEDHSRRSGSHNGWMNANFAKELEQKKRTEKRETRRSKAGEDGQ